MKKMIQYYYNLAPNKIYKGNENYYFFIKDTKFYIKEYVRDEKVIDTLVSISNELFKKGINVNTFIMNTQRSFITTYNNKKYVVEKVNDYESSIITLDDVIQYNVRFDENNLNLKNDMIESWKRRIDIFEKQILEFNKEYPIIRKSFNYYIGLAENAVSYAYNSLKLKEGSNIVLSHNRMNEGLCIKSISDPLNFVYDYKCRDISLYLKLVFKHNIDGLDELEKLLRSKYLNEFETRILVSRMLYPDYYLDEIEKIIRDKKSDEKLKKIIENIDKYEKFLLDMYIMIRKYFNIPEVEWLINKLK